MFQKLFRLFKRKHPEEVLNFKVIFEKFQQILASNNLVLEMISELDDKLGGEYIFDINYLKHAVESLNEETYLAISNLNVISDNMYPALFNRQSQIQEELKRTLGGLPAVTSQEYVLDYSDIDSDIVEITGSKNAYLGEIRNHLKMFTPDGFAITTAAYYRFMEYNNLWTEIRAIENEYDGQDKKSFVQYDRAVMTLFNKTKIPPDVEKAINRHITVLQRRHTEQLWLAVRSSAYGEDGSTQSYAGQFKSVLNCRENGVLSAYKKVIESRFKRAVTMYSGEESLNENELPMAVAVQTMIPAASAGVAYSINPSELTVDRLVIASAFGLGSAIVGGTTDADHFEVSKVDPSKIISSRIGAKKNMVTPSEFDGIKDVPTPDEKREKSSLTDDQVKHLAERIMLLERYFKRPLDVEWCFDEKGELYLLQCRPLKLPRKTKAGPVNLKEILAERPVIMRHKGQVTQRGITAGRVWQVKEEDDPEDFPVGAIAVTRHTSPRLTSIIRRCAAIITDIGSPTGHMATISREFGVPMIVNTTDATKLLASGKEITIDAEENIIYEGIVSELLEYEMEAEDVFRDLREYHILRRLLRKISPLYLIDPNSPDFTAENCRTYHDVVRFCHEKAVKFLINLNLSSRRFRGVESRKLKLPIPLGLSVIDLGGGITDPSAGASISLEMIQSAPMQAILAGLTAPGAWSTQPMQLGLSDFVSSLTKSTMTDRAAEYQGQNLAVISAKYTNLSLRLGYHFNVIDTYVSDNINDNYIYFRFVGGVTETDRRHRRAVLLKEILEKFNFKVTIKGDLVVARLKKFETSEIIRILQEIGRLIGFSRQLDTQMLSDKSIQDSLKIFFNNANKSA